MSILSENPTQSDCEKVNVQSFGDLNKTYSKINNVTHDYIDKTPR